MVRPTLPANNIRALIAHAKPQSSTPDEFMARVRADVTKFGAVVKAAGIKAE